MTADSSILKKEPQQAEIKEPLLFAEDYNNEDDIKVFDHEYWTEHLDFDPSTVRMCYQGNADYLTDFDIHPEDAHHISTPIQPRSVQATPYDYEKVKSNFCWAPIEAIKRTFKYTTQNQVLPPSSFLRKRFQSPHPFMNVRRRNEFDATDMIYSNVKAHSTGVTTAHLFTGCTSKLLDGYGCKTGHSADFLQAMQQRNITRGVPSRLIADNAPLYRGSAITKYLNDMHVSLWQCEAKYQHQNYMERRWQVVKRYTNRVLDRSGAPATMWFYAMLLVIFCLNNIVDPNLACGTQSPLAFSTGNLNDISPMLQFSFWEPVYYLSDPSDRQFPGTSDEKRGHYVGISESIGHSMTFIIVTDDTNTKIAPRCDRSRSPKPS